MKYYVDLIQKLSDLDKKRLENYINIFEVAVKNFIGLDKWLQNWSHSNQRLYKLLGNNFIREFDYSFEKNKECFRTELYDLFATPFKASYHNFYWEVLKKLNMPSDTLKGFSKVTDLDNFLQDKIQVPIKYKKEGCKQTLQIQIGTKPIRALQKIINYFKDDYNFFGFEDFRLKHSMILNDKIVKGKLCISIHPLDYLTMSDNNSNWSSCMSWMNEGCYHIGTVEMMNSNNVLCCYLKSQTPYVFGPDDEYEWNNKKWRQLVYITKDIIMSGKPYPYVNDDLSKELIKIVRQLAEANLNWNYTYGPELYQDMIHINSNYAMNKNRDWIRFGVPKKHNIIWDTKGMYNDMLNDNNTRYWCYRNKVKHNKIISVSGKAPCLCCGNNVLIEENLYEDDYNERYSNTGSVICDNCFSAMFLCDHCGGRNAKINHYILKDIHSKEYHICEECFKKRVKICPDCGKVFYLGKWFGIFIEDPTKTIQGILDCSTYFDYMPDSDFTLGYALYTCPNCKDKHKNDINLMPIKKRPNFYTIYERDYPVVKKNFDYEKYLYKNLKSAPLPKNSTETIKVV